MDITETSYNIHIFGDSHSRIYSSYYLSNYLCNVYYVGPITMHRVGRDNLTIDQLKHLSKENYKEYLPTCKPEYKHMSYPSDDKIKENDVVIFVFGEIDIRNHYAKQIQKGRNQSEIINSLVNGYIECILSNRNKHNNVKFGIQSVNPPVDEKNLKESIKEYPIQGTIQERIQATLEINKILNQKCKEHNLLFIDTVTYYQNDESLFPVNGLCDGAVPFEMDTRIKDNNVHVHIDNPEGIEHAFKVVNLPVNIKHYNYRKKCKYPGSLNKYQRDNIRRLRLIHHIFAAGLILTLFIPNKYFLITVTYWSIILFLNFFYSDGDCVFNALEFRLSNCNDNPMTVELGISRKYSHKIVLTLYAIGILTILFRLYYYFNKKNLFNLKFGLKFLK